MPTAVESNMLPQALRLAPAVLAEPPDRPAITPAMLNSDLMKGVQPASLAERARKAG